MTATPVPRKAGGLRRTVHGVLDPNARSGRLSAVNLFLSLAIILSVLIAILETEPSTAAGREGLFRIAEISFGAIFLAEYLLRLWIAPEVFPKLSPWRARMKWVFSPLALIDLVALLPLLFMAQAAPSVVLRLARLLRIFRLAKLGRMSRAFNVVIEVFASRRYELGVTGAFGAILLIVVSTLLYLAEGTAQPEEFGSIPRALWWGVVTLTTIGYGDVYPVTALGKFLAGLTAVVGIGLVAAPTGILAAGFAEALREQKTKGKS